jgi:RecJ-like exonuclease
MAILFEDKDGVEHELPTKWKICPQCEGHGKSSLYLGAFTGEQMREDPEFAEEYMAGRYDRTCETCKGSGKVEEVDRRRCNAKLLRAYDKQQDSITEMRAIERQERLFEGGWREEGWFDAY